MKSRFVALLRGLYMWLWVRPTQIVELIQRPCFYTSPTYYPEYPERLRSHWSQFWNQVGEILRFGRINTLYFMCGYDVKTRAEQRQYVHYSTFMRRRVELNKPSDKEAVAALRDKLLFAFATDKLGLRGPDTLFYSQEGKLFTFPAKREVRPEDIKDLGDVRLFCKPIDGQCGKGIFVLEVKKGCLLIDGEELSFEQLLEHVSDGRYIMQRFLEQHPAMASLHPQSINTIRLLSVRSLKDGRIHLMPSILRVGTGESVVDNTTQGGLAIGIDLESGYLRKFGFYKPCFGTKVEEHPDSNIRFCEFQIPYFEEVKRQAILFHESLPQIHSIGWDIAIGPQGPVFIEGNDNWEITGPQTCNGGLRREFEEYFFE